MKIPETELVDWTGGEAGEKVENEGEDERWVGKLGDDYPTLFGFEDVSGAAGMRHELKIFLFIPGFLT